MPIFRRELSHFLTGKTIRIPNSLAPLYTDFWCTTTTFRLGEGGVFIFPIAPAALNLQAGMKKVKKAGGE